MTIARRSTRRRIRGQALTEFALIAPIFFFVLIALIELGRAIYYIQVLDSAARDGARYAVVHGFQALCPSGPMPFGGANTCDPGGDRVIQTVINRSTGVTDTAGSLIARVKWCDASLYQAEPPLSNCGDTDLSTNQPVPCADWSDLGDGDNNRGEIVTVCVQYSYQSILGAFVPIPDFNISGRASLVVNN